MLNENIFEEKELILLELDDVLFPKKDYLLQVYYLFATFYEFNENTIKANDLVQFMTKVYEVHGEDQVFEATKTMFSIDAKYEENFNRLMANAQLPLKLLLFEEVKYFLLKAKEKKKEIAILTKGNPVEQLNKLKFIDWESLEDLKKTIKIYFVDELLFASIDPISYLANEFGFDDQQVIHITKNLNTM